MELDARKLGILKAIIDEYILSASPIGSRSISKLEGFSLSSATIRNEMADLEELGYLEQPHTSAGRIPSDKAYRLYVDQMMQKASLSEDEIKIIRAHMGAKIDEVEAVMKQTAQALSLVTHYTAIVMSPMLAANRLRHIQLVPLREGRALVVIVTSAGFSQDAVIRIPEGMDSYELERISRMLTEHFCDCRMDQIGDSMLREMGGELKERKAFLNSIVEAIDRKIEPESQNVQLSGATNMLHFPEYSDVNKAKTFLAAVEGRSMIYDLLKRASKLEFSITIGNENEDETFKDCSIVTATYRVGDEPMGSFGIIGPTRMQYGKVISVLEFMRRSLSDILSNDLDDD
ncbi:MAG: heat-inducible transcriptional repressor HrcA [Eubacteriales bacterium]|nr:heat-inducible transcriptional repressor HrcA [Eubacteriales bacterium]